MTRTWKSLAIAGLVLSLCGAASARDRHVLWTVAGKHNTVYLLGSIHVLRASDGGLPAVADAAYADAEHLVMEIDWTALAQPEALGTMPWRRFRRQTLRSVLGEDYPKVRNTPPTPDWISRWSTATVGRGDHDDGDRAREARVQPEPIEQSCRARNADTSRSSDSRHRAAVRRPGASPPRTSTSC
jgi:hypothetical protein